jgi:hypothetical protein
MSSISPFSSNNEAIFAATYAPASAATSSTSASSVVTPTPQDTVTLSHPEARELLQLGRVSYNEQAGNLTSAQGAQLDSQIQQTQTTIATDAQANGGSLTAAQAQSIAQLQNGLSFQIYGEAAESQPVGSPSPVILAPAIPGV